MEENSAFEMYKLFRREQHENFEHHRETLQNYLAFVVAVLGATIVGILELRGPGGIGVVVLAGPILNVFVCRLAIRMCDRFYLAALERIAISAKLESALGLRDPIDLTSEGGHADVLFRDKYLLPERWIEGTQYATSEEFIQQHLNAGVNRLARQTFHLVIVVNVILGVAVVVATLL